LKSRTVLVLAITSIILFLDQISKIMIKTSMVLGQETKMLGSWFKLHFVENEGMAMGISWGGELGKYSLTLFRIVAIGVIIYYIYTLVKSNASKGLIAIMALVLAGAMGNVFDSLFYGLIFGDSTHEVASFVPWGTGYKSFMQGNVVDMLSFQLFRIPNWFPGYGGQKFFPFIFNIADAAISVGIILIIVFQKIFFAEPEQEKSAD
jgi:signal peptidase II